MGYYYHGDDPTKWDPDDGGWSWHVLSTVSEWVMALALDLTFLSLVMEFKKIGLDEPRIIVHVDTVNNFLDIGNPDYSDSSSSMLAYTVDWVINKFIILIVIVTAPQCDIILL